MNPVAMTALLVAAIRAEESKRPDRLFDDPFADSLAGDEGRAVLVTYRSAGPIVPIIEVRTRWYDEALARCAADGIRQFVILAAGMDARAYRLDWPNGSRVFEVDQPDMIAEKARRIGDRVARCTRVAVGTNLAGDWPAELLSHGFERATKTAWLVEGLLQYLEPASVATLFGRLDGLSAPGSVALYDVIGRSLLAGQQLAATVKTMKEHGAPWLFGTDEPALLLPRWETVTTDPAVVGNGWKRWPFPAAPPEARDVPRGYLVRAHKP